MYVSSNSHLPPKSRRWLSCNLLIQAGAGAAQRRAQCPAGASPPLTAQATFSWAWVWVQGLPPTPGTYTALLCLRIEARH